MGTVDIDAIVARLHKLGSSDKCVVFIMHS